MTLSELEDLKARLEGIIRLINDIRHIGRPPGSNVALEVEPILIASLQNGLNITQACLQGGITRETFYHEKVRNPIFSDRMDKAEQFSLMKARQNITTAINARDIPTSKWYLERKDPEYKPKTEADLLSGGQPLKTALVEFVGDDGNNTKNQD